MKQFLRYLVLAAGFWPGVATAQVVGLSVPDTTVALGADLWLPVRVDTNVAGWQVTSLQLQLSYNPAVLEPDSFSLTGTLLNGLGWSVTMHHPSVGVVRVAAAGTTPLAGSGSILRVRMRLRSTGWTQVQFTGTDANLLNEGVPSVTLRNGWIQVVQPPSMDIWPDDGVVAVGERLQFSTGGGQGPSTWSTSDTAVATIDADGLLTAVRRGSVKVFVQDTSGTQGQIDRWVIVRAIGLSIPDTSIPATHTVDVPVRVTSLSPWSVVAGTVRVNYNAEVVTPVSVVTAGTLLEGRTPSVNLQTPGAVRLSFASEQPLLGQGTLFVIRFQTNSTTGWTGLTLAEGMFNEDLPAKLDDGSVSVSSLATINLGSSGNTLLAEDTLAFTVWGGEAPFAWSSSDSTVARIDPEGRLIGLTRGRVVVTVRDALGAIGTSNEIRVFDGAVKFEDRLALSPGWVDVPVRIARLATGQQYSSFQLKLSFNAEMLTFESLTTAGTATAAWSTTHHVSGSTIAVAGASTQSLSGTGTLCIIRFAVLPSLSLNAEAGLTVDQVLLNEGVPELDRWNGRVRIAEPPGRVSLWSPGDGWTQQSVDQELSWGTVSYAEQYELQLAVDTLFTSPVWWDSTITVNTAVPGGLQNGTVYYWRVRARNILGLGAWSEIWGFRTVALPSAAPVLAGPLSGSLDLSLTPTLSWHPSAQATSYDLQIAEDSTFAIDVRLVGSITDTMHEASTLDHARRYFWRVRGINEAGAGDWSGAWWFTTVGTVAGIPQLASPPDGSAGVSVTPLLAWHPAANAVTYHVQVAEDSVFIAPVVNVEGVWDTTHVANGLVAQRSYYWRVRTYGPTDTSAFSAVWRFMTAGPDGIVLPRHGVPDRFGLEPNFPNPFNPSTRLTFHVKEPSTVTITIYTMTGSEVERLVESNLHAGTYETWWNAARMPSGIYLCRMTAGTFTGVQRLVLIK